MVLTCTGPMRAAPMSTARPLLPIEAVFGVLSGSVALLADAGHNLSDVLGLVAAWAASALTRRPPTLRYTYGLGGFSIMAALCNAVFLRIAVDAIVREAVQRLASPQPPWRRHRNG